MVKNIFIVLAFSIISNYCFAQKSILYGIVQDKFGPLPGAKITLINEGKTSNSDVNGAYKIMLDGGKHKVMVSYSMYKTQVLEIDILPSDSTEQHFKLLAINAIDEKTSLSSKSLEKSFLDASIPVQLITKKEIEESGKTELSQVLHYLIPSFHSTHQTISDGTDHIDPVTVKGLGTDQVLVLINGKRKHSSSLLNVNGTIGKGSVSNDFNAIPLYSIERIEFLPYGAASIYGSDAIAGVINIVLKEGSGILDIHNRTGINSTGDGFTSFTGVNVGFDIGNSGFINITGEYRSRTATNRSGDYTGNVFSKNDSIDQILINNNSFFERVEYNNQRIMEIGNSATQNIGFSYNSEIKISNNAVFYSNGGRSFREGVSKGFYRLPVNGSQVVRNIHDIGFSPELVSGIQDQNITLGIKGKTKDWLVNISNSTGTNSLNYSVRNSNNASLGLASPSVFSAGGFSYALNATNLEFSRPYDWFKGSNLSMGGELRVENYQIIAGEEASWIDGGRFTIMQDDTLYGEIGSQMFPGFQSSNELNKFRTSQSAYIDAEMNIIKNLLVRLALRGESYNDVKGQITWRASTRYKLTDKISFRGGISTGYRAPSLQQVFFNNISTQFIEGEPVVVGTFNNFSRVSKALGVPTLSPELSLHTNIGATAKITNNLNFNLSLFSTDVSDRIMLSGILDSDYNNVLRPIGASSAQVFLNAIDTRTMGFDLSAFYKIGIGTASLENNLRWSYNSTNITAFNTDSSKNGLDASEVINREERSRIENAQPASKIILINSYKRKKWSVNLQNTYFGGVWYIHPNDGNESDWVLNNYNGLIETRDQYFTPKVVTDLSFFYHLKNTIDLSLRVNNLFNIYPDEHNHSANTSDGNFIYSRRVQQFGVKGTNIHAGITLTL